APVNIRPTAIWNQEGRGVRLKFWEGSTKMPMSRPTIVYGWLIT
ncbi:uncharacterized protein METZ01_LOCUS387475, partial [marine metagenome]